MTGVRSTGDLLRELAPQVLGVVLRRHGNFADAEDAGCSTRGTPPAAASIWPAGTVGRGHPPDPGRARLTGRARGGRPPGPHAPDRRPARVGTDGELVPLAEQDRTLWDRNFIAEGVALITAALRRGPMGEYQAQAAVAAMHDQARSHAETPWSEGVAL